MASQELQDYQHKGGKMKSQNLNRKKQLETQRGKYYFKRFLWNKDEVFRMCEHVRILGSDAA